MPRTGYEALGSEYLYAKVLASKALSYEEDLRALYAQYTEDETTLQLFPATRLARLLPEGGPRDPSDVERAALRYHVLVLEKLRARIPVKAEPLYQAYKLPVVIRDVELIVRRRMQGRQPPPPEELAYPEAPEVAAARRLAEEEAEPSRILRAAGLATAAGILERHRAAPLQAVMDIELIEGFTRGYGVAKTPSAKGILGNRLDMLTARAALTLAAARPPREILGLYLPRLRGHRLPTQRLAEAIEAGDTETIEKLLEAQLPRPPEEIPVLDAYTAQLRRENRILARRLYTGEPLSLDTVVALYETLLLDAEDAAVIALAGYSRQPKRILAQLLSL